MACCSRLCLAAVALLLAAAAVAGDNSSFEITIPDGYKVKGLDAYVCTTLELPNKPAKLVGVEPLAKQEVVHHILLFGCDVPYSKPKPGGQSVWDCKSTPTCGGFSETIMYGWGRNAPALDLPQGVGFSVGKGSAVKWVVAQVHYLGDRPPGDKSGVRLKLQDTPVPNSAGLLSYASWFSIPPRKKSHLVQNACCYRGFQPLTTFAVRVHTHTMGRAVFMTRLPSHPGDGEVVAVGDPQQPQGFNPVKPRVLWPGDHLTVACDFDSSDKSVAVAAGPTHEHEMCNMYLMVHSALPHIEMCSDGFRMVDEASPGNMPRSAALLPDPYPLWKPPQAEDASGKGVLGDVASVALGPDGTVWALHRGGRVWDANTFGGDDRIAFKEPIDANVVVQMHPDTGKVLRRWGAGQFWMPHMISIDRNNSVWVTDVGRHQALQFSAGGKLLMAVGEKLAPGHDKAHLCKPTQVAFLNDGSFLVSDGYCNSRVVRYNADGSHHSQYALPPARGSAPSPGGDGMGVAHSLAVDECDNELLVADREGSKVHKFELDSHALQESIPMPAKVWALVKGPYGRSLALLWSPGKPASLRDVSSAAFSWAFPNSTQLWPHDLALGPAALGLTGAGDRLLAVYVAPLCDGCGPLRKFVLFPASFGTPPAPLPAPVVLPPAQRPLAHLGVGGGGHGGAHAQPAAQPKVEGDAQEYEVDEATAEQDEKAEEQVEAAEEQEDEAEAQQLGDAASGLGQQLSERLASVEASLSELAAAQAAAGGADEYETLSSAGHRAPAGAGGASGALLVVVLGVMAGLFVGAGAVHLLHRHVLSPGGAALGGGAGGAANGGPTYRPLGLMNGAANGKALPAARNQQPSVEDLLAQDEDIEALEVDGLLVNGQRQARGAARGANGVHAGR